MRLIDIVTAPWVLMPDKLLEIREIYATHLRGEKLDLKAIEARIGQPLDARRNRDYEIEDGVAIIAVEGVIAHKANLLTQVSGGASAQVIERQIREAAADPFVRAIMLDLDSPGGSVHGVPEVAAAVRKAASSKPVSAWTSGTMASGAYWIASAADRVYIANGTVAVGSIGVVATHVDVSRSEAARGVKTTEITAGRYKRASSSYEPLSEDGRATIQQMVDAIYEVFVDAVAEGRGVDAQTVLSDMADGRIFIGRQAVQAGLADGVLSREALIDQLSSGTSPSRRGSRPIRAGAPCAITIIQEQPVDPKDTQTPTPAAQPPAPPITADLIRTAHPAVAQELIAQGRQEGAAAERTRIQAIEAVAIRGYESIVDAAKFDGKSTSGDVAAAIIGAQKAQQASALEAIHSQAPAPIPAATAPQTEAPAGKDAKPAADVRGIAARAAAYMAAQASAGTPVSTASAVAHVMQEK